MNGSILGSFCLLRWRFLWEAYLEPGLMLLPSVLLNLYPLQSVIFTWHWLSACGFSHSREGSGKKESCLRLCLVFVHPGLTQCEGCGGLVCPRGGACLTSGCMGVVRRGWITLHSPWEGSWETMMARFYFIFISHKKSIFCKGDYVAA